MKFDLTHPELLIERDPPNQLDWKHNGKYFACHDHLARLAPWAVDRQKLLLTPVYIAYAEDHTNILHVRYNERGTGDWTIANQDTGQTFAFAPSATHRDYISMLLYLTYCYHHFCGNNFCIRVASCDTV